MGLVRVTASKAWTFLISLENLSGDLSSAWLAAQISLMAVVTKVAASVISLAVLVVSKVMGAVKVTGLAVMDSVTALLEVRRDVVASVLDHRVHVFAVDAAQQVLRLHDGAVGHGLVGGLTGANNIGFADDSFRLQIGHVVLQSRDDTSLDIKDPRGIFGGSTNSLQFSVVHAKSDRVGFKSALEGTSDRGGRFGGYIIRSQVRQLGAAKLERVFTRRYDVYSGRGFDV